MYWIIVEIKNENFTGNMVWGFLLRSKKNEIKTMRNNIFKNKSTIEKFLLPNSLFIKNI